MVFLSPLENKIPTERIAVLSRIPSIVPAKFCAICQIIYANCQIHAKLAGDAEVALTLELEIEEALRDLCCKEDLFYLFVFIVFIFYFCWPDD